MVRARTGKRNTFRHCKSEDVESVLANLTSKDPELWAKEWSRVAKPYEEQGSQFEKDGQFNAAREAYVQAYAYYATGRSDTAHAGQNAPISIFFWNTARQSQRRPHGPNAADLPDPRLRQELS